MSLNKKTFIFIGTIIGIALLGIFIASRTILLRGYEDLEKRQLERNISRAIYAIDSIASEVRVLNSDWAHWDDAYNFVQDKNEEFISVNFDNATFDVTKLNIIAFADNEGNLVYGKYYDSKTNTEKPIPDSFKARINRSDVLITHIGKDDLTGIINLPEGLFFVASSPIFKSDGTGPAKGTLIMARLADQDVLDRMQDFTQFPVEIIQLKDTPFVERDHLNEDIYINAVEGKISGFGKVRDIDGEDAVVVKLDMDREVVAQGEQILSYFLLITVLIGSIVITGGVYFQERYVLAPIYKLSNGLNRIRGSGDLSQRIEVIGKDEIGRLTADVNAMLTSLMEFNKASKEHEEALSEKLSVIEKQNTDLERTKLAMMNLLEDERELEESTRREHDRLDLIISSMGEGLLVIDKDFKVVTINPTAQNLLDVKASEIIGRNWSDLAATYKKESATPLSERSFSKAISEGKTTVTDLADDHYYKTKSGKVFPIISITAPLKVEGKIVGAVKVFRDATKEHLSRKVIENEVADRTRELWEERARMFASINSLNMGFIIADKDNQIVVKNPAVSELLKINDDEITIDRLAQEFSTNMDLKSQCELCLTEKSSFGKDDVYYKDKFLRIFLTPVITENKVGAAQRALPGEAIGYVLLIEDVTNEKQLARAKDEFFAVASHELRTPLTAIRGNTSLIQDYYADKIEDPDLKEMISDMHESSVRLINIVNDFLDASRLEQGKVDFKNEEFDLRDAVNSATKELDSFAVQKGLKLNIDKFDAPILVNADKARVHQIVTNLLGNAIKFTKSGDIKVRFDTTPEIAKISVSDNGTGISPANQRLLFKKFQQAGEKVLARDVSKGTGMGLYISKLLVEGMGGKIYLGNSELGKGSTFVFELPIKKGGDRA